MTTSVVSVYEPEFSTTGWFEDSGLSLPAWYDRDLALKNDDDDTIIIITLAVLEPELFVSGADVFFVTPPIEIEITPTLFIDEDVFFHPMSVRALSPPDQMLKNEVRRVR